MSGRVPAFFHHLWLYVLDVPGSALDMLGVLTSLRSSELHQQNRRTNDNLPTEMRACDVVIPSLSTKPPPPPPPSTYPPCPLPDPMPLITIPPLHLASC